MAEVGTIQGASVMVAVEGSFGSVDATDARAIDTTAIAALTAYPLRVLRASFNSAAGALKQRTIDLQEIAVRGGLPALAVESAVAAGLPVKQVSGEITLEFELRSPGATVPASSALGILLRSCFDVVSRSAGASAAATYATANTFTVGGGEIGEFTAGDIIAVVQTNETFRFCKVTNVNVGTTTVTTQEAHGHTSGAFTVRHCHMYYPAPDGAPAGDTLAVQLTGRDAAFVYLALGARVSRVAIRENGDRSKIMAVTIMCPDGVYHSSALITVAAKMLPLGVTGTTPLRALVSPVVVTQDHAASSVPFSGTVSTLPVRAWSVDIAVTLEPIPDQGTRSGLSGLSVTTATLTGSMTQPSPSSGVDFREVLREGQRRSVGLSMAGDNDAGNGMCVWIGSVDPTEDPGITFEDMRRTQVVAFRAGDYAGDTAGAVYANAPLVIAFVA